MDFTPYARCVSLVRKQVVRAMTGWGCAEDDTAAAVLISSELVTNAIEHAHVPGERFGITLAVTRRHCLIEVADPLTTAPWITSPSLDDEHGRGLNLVATLAEDFGHHRRADGGKTVWARLTLTGPGRSSPPVGGI
ncbi:ATP-binding protein [Streptomyces lushanensis]|uniref:ATP-binding protein n=1 Tax=Streptomyces lushanensis TaxID=1434255 RepID=UPI0024809E1F|nr:ATP-binding protein [Streptomyces lushanensis]